MQVETVVTGGSGFLLDRGSRSQRQNPIKRNDRTEDESQREVALLNFLNGRYSHRCRLHPDHKRRPIRSMHGTWKTIQEHKGQSERTFVWITATSPASSAPLPPPRLREGRTGHFRPLRDFYTCDTRRWRMRDAGDIGALPPSLDRISSGFGDGHATSSECQTSMSRCSMHPIWTDRFAVISPVKRSWWSD